MGCSISIKVHPEKHSPIYRNKRKTITKDVSTSPLAKFRGSGGTAGFFRDNNTPPHKTAVIVGIDKYVHRWSTLQNAQNDARSINKMLRKRGFHTVLLLGNEATYKRVWKEIEQVHGGTLVLSLHGHGCRGVVSSFVCADSSHDPHDTSDKLTSDRIRAWSRRWDGKEFVMLADFCYGGDMVVPTTRTRGAERTRIVISAGMMREKTLDGDGHSPFTDSILQVSRENTWNGSIIDMYLRAKQLASRVKIGRLPGDEGGDVFL